MGTLYRRGNARRSNWHAEYTLHNGRRRQRSTGTPDKKTAAAILANWESEENKRARGLIDPSAERIQQQSLRPITDHASEWIQSLRAGGKSSIHVNRQARRLETIIGWCEWSTIADVTAESFNRYADHLRELKRSNQTVSHHAQVAKQFGRWLSRTDRLAKNPLELVSKPNPQADRRLNRRMLLPLEWPWLRAASSERNSLLYETAIQTGLRSGEIRAVTAAHLHAAGERPHIQVPSGETKDARPARQFITPQLAARLAKHSPRGSQPMFAELPGEDEMADMVRADLATARGRWENRPDKTDADDRDDFLRARNHQGESFDFHALRHTCGAWLAIQAVHPKTIQTVMRHSTITLTMDTYGHLFPDSEPEAIAKIGRLLCQ